MGICLPFPGPQQRFCIDYRQNTLLHGLEAALSRMGLAASEVLFVGNDLYRDVHGPQKLRIKTVLFQSGEMTQDKGHATPDYVIYNFPELLNAVRYFEDGDRRLTDR